MNITGRRKRYSMAKCLTVTLGMTGSGKTTWLRDKSPVVETDDLRVELLGDIDDYTQESLIFGTVAKRISELFDSYDDVYLGATLVDSKYRIPFLQSIKDICNHQFIIDMIIFHCDVETSKKRITKDLKENVKRANSIYLINKQHSQYLHTMSILDKEKDFYRKIKIKTLGS